MYTLNTDFYPNLTKLQAEHNFKKSNIFSPYIFTLFSALNKKILISYYGKIYSYRHILKEEYEEIRKFLENEDKKNDKGNKINNHPIYIVKCNTFISIGKKLEKIQQFKKIDTEECYAVTYVINELPKESSDFFLSNIDVEKYSNYQKEGEVLVLPLSCFEISKIEEKENEKFIYLNYLNKYEKVIDSLFINGNKKEIEEFKKSMVDSELSTQFCYTLNFKAEEFKKTINTYVTNRQEYLKETIKNIYQVLQKKNMT